MAPSYSKPSLVQTATLMYGLHYVWPVSFLTQPSCFDRVTFYLWQQAIVY